MEYQATRIVLQKIKEERFDRWFFIRLNTKREVQFGDWDKLNHEDGDMYFIISAEMIEPCIFDANESMLFDEEEFRKLLEKIVKDTVKENKRPVTIRRDEESYWYFDIVTAYTSEQVNHPLDPVEWDLKIHWMKTLKDVVEGR